MDFWNTDFAVKEKLYTKSSVGFEGVVTDEGSSLTSSTFFSAKLNKNNINRSTVY